MTQQKARGAFQSRTENIALSWSHVIENRIQNYAYTGVRIGVAEYLDLWNGLFFQELSRD
jgi:hypothetical protein